MNASGTLLEAEKVIDGHSKKRLRGLVLTNLFATPTEPSRATFNQQQFEELAKIHDLLVVVPLARRYPCAPNVRRVERPQSPGLNVVYFDVWHPAVVGRFANAAFIERAVGRLLREDAARFAPDYVLGSFAYPEGAAAVRLGRSVGVPAFIKVHGSDINVMLDGWGMGAQIRKALRKAEGVVAVSRALVEKVRLVRGSAADVLLLYNGVDRGLFRPMPREGARRELGLDTERRSILYVGNLKRDKGVLDVIHAFAALASSHPDVDVEIVGSGPALEETTTLIGDYGLGNRVRLHGPQPHRSLPLWFSAGHVLCLPSYAEGVPNVVVEALACGRPVVATRVGGIPEIVGEESGALVEPRDPPSLAKALTRVLLRDWDATRLSASVPVSDWRRNGEQLADFLAMQIDVQREGNRALRPDVRAETR